MNTRTAHQQGSAKQLIGRNYLAAHSVQLATAQLSGYNGRGLAIGTAIGKLLASLVADSTAAALPFPLTPRSNLPLGLPSAINFYASPFFGMHRK